MNRRAAIEFSANVIVIIVISSVILGLGLMLFFNLKAEATRYTDTIEQQTADQLKALMLNDNSKVAVYPNDLTIQPGKSQMTTVAVMNNLEGNHKFTSADVKGILVEWFANSTSAPVIINHTYPNPPNTWWRSNESIIVSKTSSFTYLNFGTLTPGTQNFRNVLIKMPRTAKKGQYVFTVAIRNTTVPCDTCPLNPCNNCPPYGLTKIYVTVP